MIIIKFYIKENSFQIDLNLNQEFASICKQLEFTSL
jgi:hypothetical protein